MRFEVDAVLADNDGTLVDSQPAVDRAWARWADRVGLDRGYVASQVHGRRAVDSLARLAPDRELADEDAWLEATELSEMHDVVPIPGAVELALALNGARWAVATSASVRLAHARLDAAGLARPPVLIGADLVERGKPDPQPYLMAADALGVDPKRCVVLEDSTAGVGSGAAAGCVVIGVRTRDDHDTLIAAGAATTVADLTSVQVVSGSLIEVTVSR